MKIDGLEFCQKVEGGVCRNVSGGRRWYVEELQERTHLNRDAKTVVDRAVYKGNLRPVAKYIESQLSLSRLQATADNYRRL